MSRWDERQHPRDPANGEFTDGPGWAGVLSARLAAIGGYAWGGRYGELNHRLRTGQDLSAEDESLREHLDRAIEDSPPLDHPIVVHRVFSSAEEWRRLQGLVTKRDRAWSSPAFLSASRDPNVAEDFAVGDHLIELTIHVPAGVRILDVDRALAGTGDYGQSEVLFARDARFVPDTALVRDGRLVVVMDAR